MYIYLLDIVTHNDSRSVMLNIFVVHLNIIYRIWCLIAKWLSVE